MFVRYVTAVNPNGLDLYFLNRGTVRGVKGVSGLQEIFAQPPDGETYMLRALRSIYREKSSLPGGRQLLIVVVTDGVPTDGSKQQLCEVIRSKPSNTHVSFAECTDRSPDRILISPAESLNLFCFRPEDMEYLDEMDREIPKFVICFVSLGWRDFVLDCAHLGICFYFCLRRTTALTILPITERSWRKFVDEWDQLSSLTLTTT